MASENEFHRDVHTMQYHYMCVYIIMHIMYVLSYLIGQPKVVDVCWWSENVSYMYL